MRTQFDIRLEKRKIIYFFEKLEARRHGEDERGDEEADELEFGRGHILRHSRFPNVNLNQCYSEYILNVFCPF